MENGKTLHAPLGETFQHQASLPKIPVPPLPATCEKLLAALQPLCRTAAERARAAELVSDLRGATRAQALLEARAAALPNWVEAWWETYAYFGARESVAPIEGDVFAGDPLGRTLSQTQRAATLLAGIAAFKEGIFAGTVPPDVVRGTPLCMDQYKRIFCACRLPGHPTDRSVRLFGTAAGAAASHAVVAARSQFWRLELREEGSRWLREEEIELQLRRILADAEAGRAAAEAGSLGWLTGGRRQPWAEARRALAQASAANRASLAAIESALLVVCLDAAPGASVARSMHETQVGAESGNRWYDKSVQLVVFADGKAGTTMEHSGTDGQPVVAMWRSVQRLLLSRGDTSRWLEGEEAEAGAQLPRPPPLRWVAVPAFVSRTVAEAAEHVRRERAAHVLDVLTFRAFGAAEIKRRLGVSPDAFMQLALQLAHYRQHRRLVSVYESVAMVAYRRGRTETGRPLTAATAALLGAMVGPEKAGAGAQEEKGAGTTGGAADVAALARAAAASISAYVAEATQGRGIDRHLFGLMMTCAEAGLDAPALFGDPLFARLNAFDLSTSNLPTLGVAFAVAFRLPTPQTTGVVYQLYEEELTLTVMTSKRCAWTDGAAFCALVERSCHELHAVLLKEGQTAQVRSREAVLEHASVGSPAPGPAAKL